MPSKPKKGGNGDAGQERVPLQSTDEMNLDERNNVNDVFDEEVCIEILPISMAPEWTKEYEDPVGFDENEEEQYSKSIFLIKNDNGLFVNLFDGYDWKSISEYFYFGEKQTIKIISQLTVENANDGGIINFISYSKIRICNELASIYQFVIELLQSLQSTNSDDNANINNINYPWNLIYPQSDETGLPILSQNGLYFVKLFFCGQWRSILIDDNIPMFDDKFLFPMIADSNEIWPQLLTKAILKFLILSNRLNDKLCIPLIIQLLTSIIPSTTSQIKYLKEDNKNISFKYIASLYKQNNIKKKINLHEIDDWIIITSKNNNFQISDQMIENKHCWLVIVDCSHFYKQTIYDLWSNENDKKYTNDKTVIISNESIDIDIILQINSLNKNLSEKVALYIYDQENNIKKVIEIINMNHGFASIITMIRPKQIYFIEVNGNISYSVTLYSKYSNLYISPRFGHDKIWQIIHHKIIDIQSESKYHPISETFILFNIHIKLIDENCNILFHSVFNDKILSNSLVLYSVNLDDQSMAFIPNLNLSKFTIKKNKNGYALIAFSRPTKVIKNSKYEIKIVYKGDIQYTLIDMHSTLDFKINYVHNFDVLLIKDEIVSENAAKFIFSEIYFNDADFIKIIEFIDKDTNKTVAKYSSIHRIMYVPQIFIGDKKLWFIIKFDKEKLFKHDSIECIVRIISDAPIRLFPDNSQQIKFDEIKKSWQVSKGRADIAYQTRQKYLDNIKKTKNKESIIVNEEKKMNEMIKNEQQFQSDQYIKINNHNRFISKIQKSSFENTQQFNNNDLKQRRKLRLERLEWNNKLSQIDNLKNEMKQNFDDFKQTLNTFNSEINKIIQDIKNTEPSKTKKSKICKPSTDIIFPQYIPKLLEKCKNAQQNVPKWLYGNKIDDCYIEINSILYDIMKQCNTQFSALIDHKTNIKDFQYEIFKHCCDKYIILYLTMFEQIDITDISNPKLQHIQNQAHDIIVHSIFNKLQSYNINDNELTVNIITDCLNEIEFGDHSKRDIVVNQGYRIQLKQNYVEYIFKVEQWIQKNQTK